MSNFEKVLEATSGELKKIQSEFQEKGKKALHNAFNTFFELNPECKAVVWNQYTPYFNDGDECVFRVGDLVFTNAEGDELSNVSSWGDYEGEDEALWARNARTASEIALDNFIQSREMYSILEESIGDHILIYATRDGFDIQDYEHD